MKTIFKSFKAKMFVALSLIVVFMLVFLIAINTFVFEKFYMNYQQDTLRESFAIIENVLLEEDTELLEEEVEKIIEKNNCDILIENKDGVKIYTSSNTIIKINEQLFSAPPQLEGNAPEHSSRNPQPNKIIAETEKYSLLEANNKISGRNYIVLAGETETGNKIYIYVPINSIDENVSIVNRFTFIAVSLLIVLTVFVIFFMTRKITAPILEINEIAERMSKLDFSKRYTGSETGDEINNLGKSINAMSDRLENTIKQLKNTNVALEKDLEEKYKIDEMRKQFISDVSHELKTPIALIQAYGEGLQENETTEENRKYYTEVIVDEASKMDKLVKQLLELMKLEYGSRKFNDQVFDIVNLEQDIVKKAKVILEEKGIELIFKHKEQINVLADDFYIEQVFTNYLTNAIKYSAPVEGKTKIEVANQISQDGKTVRVIVKNTGENLAEEALQKIWERFYKMDVSRNRDEGGIGIGLSLVKAIMSNYESKFGVNNIRNGVEFYFELNIVEE